jgi:hypothetical protein
MEDPEAGVGGRLPQGAILTEASAASLLPVPQCCPLVCEYVDICTNQHVSSQRTRAVDVQSGTVRLRAHASMLVPPLEPR